MYFDKNKEFYYKGLWYKNCYEFGTLLTKEGNVYEGNF